MALQIRWTHVAADDLEAISDYIRRDSSRYADLVIEQIIQAVEQASSFPRMGRQVPEFRQVAVREMIVYHYRVIYRIEQDSIVVIGVVHGARRLRHAIRGRLR